MATKPIRDVSVGGEPVAFARDPEELKIAAAAEEDQAEQRRQETARGTNATPKTSLEEKFERQNKALKAMVVATFEFGAASGLAAAQVSALREALESLGWLPERRKG